MTKQQQAEMFNRLAGSEEAGAFVGALWRAVSLWDDLIDGDRAPPAAEVTDAMWGALLGIPGNPFFVKHRTTLMPVMATAACNWLAGNALAAEGHRDLDWFLRMGFVDVVALCALINGGPQAAVRCIHDARLFLKDEEPLSDYVAEAPQAPAPKE